MLNIRQQQMTRVEYSMGNWMKNKTADTSNHLLKHKKSKKHCWIFYWDCLCKQEFTNTHTFSYLVSRLVCVCAYSNVNSSSCISKIRNFLMKAVVREVRNQIISIPPTSQHSSQHHHHSSYTLGGRNPSPLFPPIQQDK